MLITSIDPFVQEFDRLAQWVFGAVDGTATRGPALVPMDAVRGEDGVVLRFDLPGADPGTVDVTVDRNVLTVAATRTEERADGERHLTRERVTGSFARRVYLAETIDSEKIDAAYDNGVLTVRLPLKEKALPRKIEIKAGDRKELSA